MITLPVGIVIAMGVGALVCGFLAGLVWRTPRVVVWREPLPVRAPACAISPVRAEQLRKNCEWWAREIAEGRAPGDTPKSMLADMQSAFRA